MSSSVNISLDQKIASAIREQPGISARELASKLGVERNQVNSLLYGTLSGLFVQDKKYRWYPAEHKKDTSGLRVEAVNTPLARLCRYYLACLGHDDTAGVSVFAQSQYGEPDYSEFSALPGDSADELFRTEGAQRLLGQLRRDKSRLAMYFGYPVLLRKHQSRNGWEGFFVEPLILLPVEVEESAPSKARLVRAFPIINLRALKRLTGVEQDGLMEELVQLEEELGLTVSENELPELDELVQRLASIRPEWQWAEPCNPTALGNAPPLSRATAEGLYNRAIVVVAERSPYTQGLEAELKQLAQLPESAYRETVLGQWLANAIPKSSVASDASIVEVMPLNLEQRQAVQSALAAPLTVITGPPGTGKSQVVSDILINAAWQGKRVLFASKNNKAVDVVETRINNLGPRPLLLRVGSNQYQAKLAEYLLGLLAAKASQDDQRAFDEALAIQRDLEAQDAACSKAEEKLVALRNRVDETERSVERVRAELRPEVFASARSIDFSEIEPAVGDLSLAVRRANRSEQALWLRLTWPVVRGGRLKALSETAARVNATVSPLGATSPDLEPNDDSITAWTDYAKSLIRVLALAVEARAYFDALDELQKAIPLSQLAKQRTEILKAMASNAGQLWSLWLRLQPAKLSREDRQLLNKYGALLKMVIDAGSEGRLSASSYREYSNLFAKAAHLLPCWAVTSLSAKGRIPFEAAFFDLVVFDEASQCDIASALPLLFRAKRAAVIGDPKQLAHISGLPKGQDQKLLEKFGLIGSHPQWSYSYNSLFDLGSGMASGEDLVNLKDHHRSHADIVEFSNNFFYEGQLRVATRYDRLKRPAAEKTGVRWVHVTGRTIRPSTGGAFNREEAGAVLEELRKLLSERNYSGSVGVVSPFRAQANLIREIALSDHSLAERLARQDFLADTVHKFQGDERDVMIFSPVLSRGITPGATGFLRNNGNLFNVAITRARAMLIVVGDLDACSSCEVEYLAEFAQYTQKLREAEAARLETQDYGSDYPAVANPEQVSDWERLLYRALYKRGIRTMPQFSVEKYLLDLALVNEDRRLNIEVDGERYHRAWNGELCRRDQLRNQRLYELGWDVMRFWVYEVRDDLNGCVRKVETWLKQSADRPN